MTEPKPRRFTAEELRQAVSATQRNADYDIENFRWFNEIARQALSDAERLQTLEAQHTADLNRIDALMQQHAIYEQTITELRNKDKQ